MRIALLFVTASLVASAADPLAGDWKLRPEKSSGGAKSGRVLIEASPQGGYLQFSETFFTDDPVLRFNSVMRDGGVAEDAQFNNHPIRYLSRKTGEAAYEILIADPNTGATIKSMSVSATSKELKIAWTDPAKPPMTLVYEHVAAGPLLHAGAPVEHEFGPAAADEYRVELHAGDYCQGKVDQKGGTINVAAYRPDGSRIRNFGGPPEGKKTFAFEAASAGTYKIVLRSATSPAKSYAVSIDKAGPAPAEPPIRAAPQSVTSPKIAALRTQIEKGNRGTVADFWSDVEKSGTPLAEPIDGNNDDVLVTFLWRGKSEVRDVLVLWGPFAFSRPADYMMTRLADTDVWYRTLKIRRGARFVYQVSPNDPLTFEEESGALRAATAQADPLNPHKVFENPTTTNYEYQSLAELPGAKPQPYLAKRAGVPAGRLERHQIKSSLLDNERNLSVYLPPGYQREGAANNLLVVFDERSYLTVVPTNVILDNLLSEKKIAPTVAVLIDNPSQDSRSRELPPNPKFADFLNDELIPWVRQNYNVTKDPALTVVAGSSYGGIASTYAGLRHPETFGNILCQSGSFWWSSHKPEPYQEPNYFAKEFIKSPKLPLKFYMDAGSFEVDLRGGGGAILEPSRHMRDVLLAKGYEVHYQEFIGGHDYMSWRGTLADGLIALVGLEK